ncbi:PREDICTED: transcription factor bHLH52-like [Ipomoea nil]|uniref:transcription factor bHLH52-like n=1 Tax=Ipomoea nil TaxID=35883 RepID=UPI000901DBE4|nr:PREDICTED: transcription factor bHLH52-like [Ipomoea nil]
MASLSYCSNWETTHDHYLNFSETLDDASGLVMASPPFFPQQQTVVDHQLEAPAPAELLFGFNDRSFLLPESSPSLFSFDPLFNSGEFIFSDNYVSPPPPPPEYLFPGELEFQAHPKRQKLYHDHFPLEITQNCFGAAFIPNLPLLQDLKPSPPPPSSSLLQESLLPELPSGSSFPAYCDHRGETEVAKKNDSGKCGVKTLSAQSIAARERRRRIADKTQELGKLIPGGQKMNTAEMFQAGYKYIKYMQTQLSVLQSCHDSSQESGETYMSEELESLVGSVLIQEKLYSNDKCLVPQKFIQSLPNAHQLDQASPLRFDTKSNSDPIS